MMYYRYLFIHFFFQIKNINFDYYTSLYLTLLEIVLVISSAFL